jgi:hypothetical protein
VQGVRRVNAHWHPGKQTEQHEEHRGCQGHAQGKILGPYPCA